MADVENIHATCRCRRTRSGIVGLCRAWLVQIWVWCVMFLCSFLFFFSLSSDSDLLSSHETLESMSASASTLTTSSILKAMSCKRAIYTKNGGQQVEPKHEHLATMTSKGGTSMAPRPQASAVEDAPSSSPSQHPSASCPPCSRSCSPAGAHSTRACARSTSAQASYAQYPRIVLAVTAALSAQGRRYREPMAEALVGRWTRRRGGRTLQDARRRGRILGTRRCNWYTARLRGVGGRCVGG